MRDLPNVIAPSLEMVLGRDAAPALAYNNDEKRCPANMTALGAFAGIVKRQLSSTDEDRLRGELLLRRARDTLALFEAFRALLNDASW